MSELYDIKGAIKRGDLFYLRRALPLVRGQASVQEGLFTILERADADYTIMTQAIKITQLLVKNGADPNVINPVTKESAVTQAAGIVRGDELMRALLTRGCIKGDPNQVNGDGLLPLEKTNRPSMLCTLIRHGADVLKPNRHGLTPLDAYDEEQSILLPEAIWEGVLKPLLKDGQLEASALFDDAGKPTATLTLMCDYTFPDQMCDPNTFEDGMATLARVRPYLPPFMRDAIDLSAYHSKMLEETPDQTHIGRYERHKADRKPLEKRGRE